MTNNVEKEKQGQPIRCWRCGRMIFENIRTGRSGCLNTKCRRIPFWQ